ncbi:MAG: DUF3667 domain-containing protein [Bacillota bacterium]
MKDPTPAGYCVSCGAALHGPYCAQCGEKRLPSGSYSLKQILHDWQSTAALGEGKLVNTFRHLLFRPGFLTREYFLGRRVAYTRPAALFLVCNLLFFLLCSWDTFTTPLTTHMRDRDMLHRDVARTLVQREVMGPNANPAVWQQVYQDLESGEDMSIYPKEFGALHAYALRFNDRESILSRALIVAIIPITAVLGWVFLMFLGENLARQFIFSAHFWSAFLLVITLQNGLALAVYEFSLHVLGRDLRLIFDNRVFSSLLVAVMAAYTYAALRRFTGLGVIVSVLVAGWYLFAAIVVSLSLYRSLLFFITYASLKA